METLEKHTHKPSGDIFVFRHAFLWGEGMYTESDNSEFVEGCDYMKNNSPQKQAAISWIILMIGILLAVIGAMTAKEYRVNLCLLIGAMVVIGGIVYHLTMMKCPYCGCSLVGYRPIQIGRAHV